MSPDELLRAAGWCPVRPASLLTWEHPSGFELRKLSKGERWHLFNDGGRELAPPREVHPRYGNGWPLEVAIAWVGAKAGPADVEPGGKGDVGIGLTINTRQHRCTAPARGRHCR